MRLITGIIGIRSHSQDHPARLVPPTLMIIKAQKNNPQNELEIVVVFI